MTTDRPSYVIRPAIAADAEALGLLHLDVWDDAYTGLIPQRILDERRARADERIGRWRGILGGAHGNLVAEAPEGLIGFGAAGPRRDEDVPVDLELWGLYVRAAWWGAGVGYALMRALIGDRAAYLWVLEGNERALAFYERQGFRLDGTVAEHEEGRHVRMVRAGT